MGYYTNACRWCNMDTELCTCNCHDHDPEKRDNSCDPEVHD